MLTIAEELFLLACHDPGGTYIGKEQKYRAQIAMGAIFELVFQEGIIVDVHDYVRNMDLNEIYNQMKNKPDFAIRVYDKRPTGDRALDIVLRTIGNRSDLNAQKWAKHIGSDSRFLKAVEDNLIMKKVLKKVKKRRFAIIPYTSLEGDRMYMEAETRMRIASVAGKTTAPDDRSIAVISILHNTDLARMIFQDGHKEIYYVIRDFLNSRGGFENVLWLVQTNFDITKYHTFKLSDIR